MHLRVSYLTLFPEAVFDNSARPCSYLYTGGQLTSIPASRAAVFKDRSLSPMDKRLLTRFLMQLGSSMHGNPFPQVHNAGQHHGNMNCSCLQLSVIEVL